MDKTIEKKLLKCPIKLETVGPKRAIKNPLKVKNGEAMPKYSISTQTQKLKSFGGSNLNSSIHRELISPEIPNRSTISSQC